MLVIGNALADSVRDRIHKGVNANDEPAKPLKGRKGGGKGYPEWKIAHGLAPIRDWFVSGATLRSLKVLRVSENQGSVGFTSDKADKIAHFLNAIDKSFGISPTDRKALNAGLRKVLEKGNVIKVEQRAA